jgi:hypothetical protein
VFLRAGRVIKSDFSEASSEGGASKVGGQGEQLRCQLVISCRIKQSASRRWYIESAFGRFAWTGSCWAPHVEGEGIRHHISDWEYKALAEQYADEQGFAVIVDNQKGQAHVLD